jgi:hypothetical protein
MKVTNENNTETPLLTNGDLAIAAYAISQCFNAYLESYEREDFTEEMTREQMESSMEQLRMSFTKFDSLVKVLNESGKDASELDQTTDGDAGESQD